MLDSLPVCYTDASYEGGNNTPKELVNAATKYGYSRIVIHDTDTMSATINAYKYGKKSDIGIISAVELEVHDPELAWVLLWAKHSDLLLKLQSPSLNEFTAGAEWISSLSSRSKLKADEATLTECWEKSTIKVSLIAQGHRGYISLMRLSSIRSLRKKELIDNLLADQSEDISIEKTKGARSEDNDEHDENNDASSIINGPLLIKDLEDFGQNIYVLLHGSQISMMYKTHPSTMDWINKQTVFTHISVTPDVSTLYADLFKNLRLPCVAWMSCRYISELDYDFFVTKVAVHQKTSFRKNDFIPPPRSQHWMHQDAFVKLMEPWTPHRELFELEFWNSLSPLVLEEGRVDLPNYDMDLKKTVDFAYEQYPLNKSIAESSDDPLERFDVWLRERGEIKSDISDSAYLDFRKRRLNDICLLQLSLIGYEKRMDELFPENRADYEKEYKSRLEMEFNVIEGMGFSGYFLIVYDIVRYAREIGAPVGPGRGSAAGSLLVYCLEITDVDPIANGLQFERFLNPERVSMPDIDTDFFDGVKGGRSHILKYIASHYQQKGEYWPSTCQICNVNKYNVKSAISRTRAAFNLSMDYEHYLKRLVKSCQESQGISDVELSWDHILNHETIKIKSQREPILALVLKHAKALTGKRSSFGVHAAGVVISPTDITNYSAVAIDRQGRLFTQYDKDDIEFAGLVKLDILGLETLGIIDIAVSTIQKQTGVYVDPRKIPWDDPAVIRYINSLHLVDVFQLNGGGIRRFVKELQPESISEIAVLSAIFRPGPLQSEMDKEFVNVKFGRKQPYYDHPALKDVTGDTYGCIVYQEQVMSIVRKLAGYSLGVADMLRRAMGKKKFEEMIKHKYQFNISAQKHWRQSFIDAGVASGSPIRWDPCLNDLRSEIERLDMDSALTTDGYFADVTKVVPAIGRLLNFDEKSLILLAERLDHYMFNVRDFKQEYMEVIRMSIIERLRGLPQALVDEVELRVFYAISQMVRFNQIFNKIEKFAGYGFNKSHALAYAVVTYQSAYIKYHYPVHFYSASLNCRDVTSREEVFHEMRQVHAIDLRTPDLNESNIDFEPISEREISYGLGRIKSVGKSAGHIIAQDRIDNGPYLGVWTAISRLFNSGLKQKDQSTLISAGAFDSLGLSPVCKRVNMQPRNWIQFVLQQYLCLKTSIPTLNSTWIERNVSFANPHESLILSVLFMSARLYEHSPRKGEKIKTIISLTEDSRKECVKAAIEIFPEIWKRKAQNASNNRGVVALLDWMQSQIEPSFEMGTSSVEYSVSAFDDNEVKFNLLKKIDILVTESITKGWSCEHPHENLLLWLNNCAEQEFGSLSTMLQDSPDDIDDMDVKWSSFVELWQNTKDEYHAMTLWENQADFIEDMLPTIMPVNPLSTTVFEKKNTSPIRQLTPEAFSFAINWLSSNKMGEGLLSKMCKDFGTSGQSPDNWLDATLFQSLLYFKLLQSKHAQWEPIYKAWVRSVLNASSSQDLEHAISLIQKEHSLLGCYLSTSPAKAINLAALAESEPAGTYLDGSPIPLHLIDKHLERRRVSTFGLIQDIRMSVVKYEASKKYNQKKMNFFIIDDVGNSIQCLITGDSDVKKFESVITEGSLVILAAEVKYNEKFGLSLQIQGVKRYYPNPVTTVIGI